MTLTDPPYYGIFLKKFLNLSLPNNINEILIWLCFVIYDWSFVLFSVYFIINAIQYVNVTAVQLFFYGGRLLQHSAGQK